MTAALIAALTWVENSPQNGEDITVTIVLRGAGDGDAMGVAVKTAATQSAASIVHSTTILREGP